MVAPNLFFLKSGGVRKIAGLKVAYLGGHHDSLSYQCAPPPCSWRRPPRPATSPPSLPPASFAAISTATPLAWGPSPRWQPASTAKWTSLLCSRTSAPPPVASPSARSSSNCCLTCCSPLSGPAASRSTQAACRHPRRVAQQQQNHKIALLIHQCDVLTCQTLSLRRLRRLRRAA